MKYMIANLLLALIPPTRFFGLKRTLLRALGITVGQGTRICGGVQFFGAGRVAIGRDCWIGINTRFYTSLGRDVTIGDRCDVAPDVCFMNGTHEMGGPERRAGAGMSADIVVGSGSWVGVRSILLGGARIGEGSMVAAGSLVLGQDTPPDSLLAGSPAKLLRKLDR
jgi:acetyltransferase-like isoleucine patch superfamily enzyme